MAIHHMDVKINVKVNAQALSSLIRMSCLNGDIDKAVLRGRELTRDIPLTQLVAIAKGDGELVGWIPGEVTYKEITR